MRILVFLFCFTGFPLWLSAETPALPSPSCDRVFWDEPDAVVISESGAIKPCARDLWPNHSISDSRRFAEFPGNSLLELPEDGQKQTAINANAFITGSVLDADTSAPVEGVVRIQRIDVSPFAPGATVFAPILENGDWEAQVQSGTHVIHLSESPTHLRVAWPDIPCDFSAYCSVFYTGQPVEANAQAPVTNIELRPSRGATIQGFVTDTEGSALENARVTVFNSNELLTTSVTTNAQGFYQTVRPLPPGRYQAFADRRQNSMSSATEPFLHFPGAYHDGTACPLFSNSSEGCRDTRPSSFIELNENGQVNISNFQLEPELVTPYRLHGQLLDRVTGQPIKNLRVLLAMVPAASISLLEGGQQVRLYSGLTDEDGNYEVIVPAADDYLLDIRPVVFGLQFVLNSGPFHPGVLPQNYPEPCLSAPCPRFTGQTVQISEQDTQLNIEVDISSRISGRVLLANGEPAEFAQVVLSDSYSGRNTFTDENGFFELSGIPAGSYSVSAQANTQTTIPPSPIQPEWQITYLGDIPCQGEVCGHPFGTQLEVSTDSDVENVDITLQLGGQVTGAVRRADNNAPLTGSIHRTLVWLFRAEQLENRRHAGLAFTDEAGNFSIDGLKPGPYKVLFTTTSADNFIDTAFGGFPCPRGACSLEDLPTVFVTAGATVSGIDGELPKGFTISGRVLDSQTGEPPIHRAFSKVTGRQLISVISSEGLYAGFGEIDGDGFFQTRTGFPPGEYYSSTFSTRNEDPFGDNYIDQAFQGVDCPWSSCEPPSSASKIELVDQAVSDVDFMLRQGGQISGSLFASGGTPLAFVPIHAFDQSGNKVASARTNLNGAYLLQGLPTGSYRVITENGSAFHDQAFDRRNCEAPCSPLLGDLVTVVEGETTKEIDFNLVSNAVPIGSIFRDRFE